MKDNITRLADVTGTGNMWTVEQMLEHALTKIRALPAEDRPVHGILLLGSHEKPDTYIIEQMLAGRMTFMQSVGLLETSKQDLLDTRS